MTGREDCLAGGGDMGARMRAHDWDRSPLGPVSAWPQSLRTAVGIMLASGYPMYIAWGPRYIQFYNDAYRPILGSSKHPAALGTSTVETFREIWDFIGPMFDGVMRAGESTTRLDQLLPLDRSGYLENCYFTYSYSAIPIETGGVGGVMVTCMETTARVLAERRLRVLRALGACGLDVTSVDNCLLQAAEALAPFADDLPFFLVYRVDRDEQTARLHQAVRMDRDSALCPAQIQLLSAPSDPFSVGRCVRQRRPVVTEGLAVAAGPWPEPNDTAVTLPILCQGTMTAVLVAGVSARRRLDADYRGFLEQIAATLGASAANARAYEMERGRADSLAELDRAKTAFFTNISHEFRTPLTLLLSPLEDEIEAPDVPPRARDNLRVAARNARRLLRLVNALLDFSRLEAGRVQPVFAPVDVAELTRTLASLFESSLAASGIQFDIACSEFPETPRMDAEMWEKIVLNLVSNAVKYTRRGKISLRLYPQGSNAVLEIADSGIGIDRGDLERIFERFYRLRNGGARSQEGAGIGLALVKELVALHGGRVTVDSTPGVGSTFTVVVPTHPAAGSLEEVPVPGCIPDADTESPALRAAWAEEVAGWLSPDVDDVSAPGERSRVLVVDDNPDMRAYVSGILRSHWDVVTAGDGRQAVASVRRQMPDVVITDVMMPGLDGFELIAEMRADSTMREIPILVLSARAGDEARIEGLDAGADDYLVKPFSSRELVARVRNLLNMRRVRQQATDRETASRLIAEREHRRAESERHRLHSLFMQAPASICILRGPTHVFEFANPRYQELVGGRDLLGRTVAEAVPEAAAQGYIELLDEVYRSGNPFHAQEFLIVLGRGEASRDCYLNFVYQATRNDQGEIDGILVLAVEVTDQVRARQKVESLAGELSRQQGQLEVAVLERTRELRQRTAELEAANRQLRDLDRLKSEFLATISHELRTPLNAIIGFSGVLLLQADGLPSRTRQYIGHIAEGGEQLLSLVNDMLDLARIEAGRLDLDIREFALDEAVAIAVRTVEPAASAKRIRLVVKTPACIIQADRQRFSQILLNLLTNAVKFSPSGGTIEIHGGFDGMNFHVGVTDGGAGILPENQKNVFLPFQSLAAGTADEIGTGLGLAISQRLAEAHGGRIDLVSASGVGSTFTLVIPQEKRPLSVD